MLKKCFGMLALTFGLATSIHAQFTQSVGFSVAVMHTTIGPEGYQDNLTFIYKDITYFPRYNVVEMGNSSISIGAPIGLGFGSATNYSQGRPASILALMRPWCWTLISAPSLRTTLKAASEDM